jgi:aspartokinase/homoserine dehydrogenase 1
VPEPLRAVESAAEYMQRLPEFDGEMADKLAAAQASGEVLRYVGVVDVKAGKGSVELRRYPASHPFAQLQVRARRARQGWAAGGCVCWTAACASGAKEAPLTCLPLQPLPSHALQGSDNIIAFTTARYGQAQPLIVRGPGAGAAVTAGGVFSDLLRLAAYLGAPS